MNEKLSIVKFEHDRKIFDISLTSDLKFIYSYFDNDKVQHFNLMPSDYDIIYFILSCLKVDKNKSVFVRNEFINGRKYSIFYDEYTRNFFWQNSSSLTNEDNLFLNMKYNHCKVVIADELTEKADLDEKVPDGMYRKLVFNKKTKKWISILCIGAISIGLLTGIISNESYKLAAFVQNPLSYVSSAITYNMEGYDYQLIKDAINSNKNLTKLEKEQIEKVKFVFDEYHQYMNLPQVISRLTTLEIIYNEEPSYSNAQASYNRLDNTITVYSAKNIEDVFQENAFNKINEFYHELFHMLQDEYSGNLSECSNEVFTREALRRLCMMGELPKYIISHLDVANINDFGRGYSSIIQIYYAISEFIPDDILIKFQFSGDDKIIVDVLSAKGIDKSTVYKILTNLNSATVRYTQGDEADKKNEIWECLNIFYKDAMGWNYDADLSYYFKEKNKLYSLNTDSQLGKFLCEQTFGYNYASYKEQLNLNVYWFPRTIFSNSIPENSITFNFGYEDDCYEILDQLGLRYDSDGNKAKFNLIVNNETKKKYIEFFSKDNMDVMYSTKRN